MSAKSILYGALSSYSDLTDIVPVNNITYQWFDKLKGFPQITLTRVSETGQYHGDGEIEQLGTVMQIDLWTTSSPLNVEVQTKRAIKTIDFANRSAVLVIAESYDTDEMIYRVTLQVTIYEKE